MIAVRVDVDIINLINRLNNSPRRLVSAVTNALNATALNVQEAERQAVPSKVTMRKRAFILREVAKIDRKSFANARTGKAYVEVAVGQKPRLILSTFEKGGTKDPFIGKHVGVPITGRPARPSKESPVRAAWTFQGLNIIKHVTATNKPGRRSKRAREDVTFSTHQTKGGKVQFKGARRTFILTHSAKLPFGGVLQRVGPGRDDIRSIYVFEGKVKLRARLDFVTTARRAASRWFRENLEAAAIRELNRGLR